MESSEYLQSNEELMDPIEIYSHRIIKSKSSEEMASTNCTAICMVLTIYEIKYAVLESEKKIVILISQIDFEMVKDLALQNNYCHRWSAWLKKNDNIDVYKTVT